MTVNVWNFQTLVLWRKGLDKQGRPKSGSSLFAIQTTILWIPALKTNILFENRKRIGFEILEHLLYDTVQPVWKGKITFCMLGNFAFFFNLRFPTIWHFDKCRLGRASAAFF